MSDKLEYLGHTLNARTYDTATEIAVAVQTVMRQLVPKGQTGAAAKHIDTEAINLFSSKVTEACQFAFNLTGSIGPEVVGPLSFFAGRVETIISDEVRSKMDRLGLPQDLAAREFVKLQGKLQSMRFRLLDDYSHGMMGNSQLKKDPVVSIVSNQTNSPGALQQIGVGDFSQKAFIQNHQPLIDAVNKALASSEFAALKPDQKEGFKDVADALLDEAKKPTPDPGKLRRWGHRLAELGTQLGLEVAATEIVHIVTSIFSGGG